jgi:transposase-like protein
LKVDDSFSHQEKLMDEDLMRFRQAAARENAGRPAIRRRYSPALQRQAVEYCHARREQGDSVGRVAAALGVAEFSLQRWLRHARSRPAFRPVAVVPAAPPASRPAVVVRLTAEGPRVEGLDLEAAAHLLRLLR